MYIDPYVAGILTVIGIEIAAFVIAVIAKASRR